MGLDVFRFTNILIVGLTLREMCPNTEIFVVGIFPHSD